MNAMRMITEPETMDLPLSYGQRAMWVCHATDPHTTAYHVGCALKIRSPLELTALERAWDLLIDRHSALRTTFTFANGAPVQRIHRTMKGAFTVEDLPRCPEEERATAITRAFRTPFDLQLGPVARLHVVRRAFDDAVVLITVHHIVFDGWSLWQVLDELHELYDAVHRAESANLPTLSASYGDFTRWQRSVVKGREGDTLRGFWKRTLHGAPPTHAVPFDTPRPPRQIFEGASFTYEWTQPISDAVRSFAESHQVTPFVVLMSAFQALIARYSGADDLVIGTPATGRTRPEFSNVVGYFVNLVPIRAMVKGTFQSLLDRTRDAVLEGMSHQDLPFPALVETLTPHRDPSVTPLFQITFAYQKSQRRGTILNGSSTWGSLTAELYPLRQQEGQFDLELEVIDTGSTLRAVWKYATSLFQRDTVERMARHYETLLTHALAHPSCEVARLPLLTTEERRALIARSLPRVTSPDTGTLADRFSRAVARFSERTAVMCEGRTMTYRELDERAESIADLLAARGITQGMRVGVSLGRSVDLVATLIAILKLGAAYVPLDPTYPEERISFMAKDAEVSLVVTDRNEPMGENLILSLAVPHPSVPARRRAAFSSELAAYVIYTSGSTGTPKGVSVTHRNVCRLFDQTDHWYHFNERDVWTLFHSYAFDFSVWEMWGALLFGGRLVIVPQCVTRDPKAFRALLIAEQVTVLNQTPSAFSHLVHADLSSDPADYVLRSVIFGGEALDLHTLIPWFDRYGDTTPTLVNMYGITETTVHVTYRPLSRRDCEHRRSVIGVPIPDLSLFLLDAALEPVPPGVVGELFVGGAGVAAGYLGRPELNAQRFIDDPFVPHGTLYRTGDLARRLPDGDLEYLGRCDMQVKIRGFRIEPGEIEALLSSLPGVSSATVLVTGSGDERALVAYVARSGERPSPDDLRTHLRTRLPEYMIPAEFVMLDVVPLTSNGKVDRAALIAIPRVVPELSRSAAPRNEMERRLALIWERILKRSRIGIHDRFFDIGGHSFLATQLLARISDEFGITLTLPTLVTHQTIAELAPLLIGPPSSLGGSILPLTPGSSGTPFFCVAGGGGSALYYQRFATMIAGEYSVYGIQAIGLDGVTLPERSVERMATRFLSELRTIQPRGPYLLGGHCFGGIVAYEMCQQIIRAGETVRALVVLDAPAPDGRTLVERSAWSPATWVVKVASMLEESLSVAIAVTLEEVKGLSDEERAEYLTDRLRRAEVLPEGAGVREVRGLLQVFKANSEIRYRPEDPRPVPMILLRAGEAHPEYDFAASHPGDALGWSTVNRGRIIEREVPGNHLTMLSPPAVATVVSALRDALSELGEGI